MAEKLTKPPSELRIDAELLIPGRGDPIKNATLICRTANASSNNERSKILYGGSTSDLPSKYSSLSATKVPVLMPGLWDAHVHYFGTPDLNLDKVALIRPALAGIRPARDVVATLNAGYTSI